MDGFSVYGTFYKAIALRHHSKGYLQNQMT